MSLFVFCKLTWVTDPGVEDSVGLLGPEVLLVVDSSRQHLLTEREQGI